MAFAAWRQVAWEAKVDAAEEQRLQQLLEAMPPDQVRSLYTELGEDER